MKLTFEVLTGKEITLSIIFKGIGLSAGARELFAKKGVRYVTIGVDRANRKGALCFVNAGTPGAVRVTDSMIHCRSLLKQLGFSGTVKHIPARWLEEHQALVFDLPVTNNASAGDLLDAVRGGASAALST